jgi:hypothetical protein
MTTALRHASRVTRHEIRHQINRDTDNNYEVRISYYSELNSTFRSFVHRVGISVSIVNLILWKPHKILYPECIIKGLTCESGPLKADDLRKVEISPCQWNGDSREERGERKSYPSERAIYKPSYIYINEMVEKCHEMTHNTWKGYLKIQLAIYTDIWSLMFI